MLRQVVKIAFGLSLLFGLGTFSYQMLAVPLMYYEGTWYFSKSYFLSNYYDTITIGNGFWNQAANTRSQKKEIEVPIKKAIAMTKPFALHFKDEALKAAESAIFGSNIVLALAFLFFIIRGRYSKTKKHLSGRKVVHPLWLRLRLKMTRMASPISIGSVPLVKGSETRHLLITGGTGTGKTNCLYHLLDQLKNKNEQVLIVDTTGSFVSRYYDSSKDVILNPFNNISTPWSPWAECENSNDFANLAEAFIPQSHSELENYWRTASRSLFSSILQKLRGSEKVSEAARWILYENLPTLCQFLAGTKAASHLDMSSEKTASSVRSVAATFLESLEHLKDTSSPFSINEWVRKDHPNSWLFLQCMPRERAIMQPLLSAWVSTAIRALISSPQNLKRRLWFIIDELSSLQKVKDLEVLLTEGRKYGGSCALSLQSLAQLENIYGKEVSQIIIGNTATKITFAEQDPEIAARISRAFGESEIQELYEGISYGAHESRDSVNLSMHKRNIPTISPTKIHSLKTNQALIKLMGEYPITKIKIKIN
jgi:type IV conjugative transfer system coupling protein TraD